MSISSLIRRCINGIWYAFSFTIIVVALLLSALRLFVEDFAAFKPEIEQYVHDTTGATIRIRDMRFSWRSSGPALRVQDMTVEAPDGQWQAGVRNGLFILNLWQSLWHRELITSTVEFQGVQVRLRESTTKATKSEPGLDSQQDIHLAIEWLLKQKNVELYDAYLLWQAVNGKRLSLATPLWVFHGSPYRQQMKGSLSTPKGGALEVRIDRFPEKSGKFFLSIKDISLDEWPLMAFGKSFSNLQGLVNSEVWGSWKNGQLESLSARSAIKALTMTGAEPRVDIPSFWLSWRREGQEQWHFLTSNIALQPFQKKAQAFQLEGWRWSKGGSPSWHITGLALPVSLISQWAQPVLPEAWRGKLKRSNMTGEITRLSATVEADDHHRLKPTIHLQFKNLSADADGFGVGVTHLDGKASLSSENAHAVFMSEGGTIAIPSLFGGRIDYNRLLSQVEWAKEGDNRWRVLWPRFSLTSKDLDLSSRGQLDMDNGTPHLSMTGALKGFSVHRVNDYLPSGIMSDKLVRYLTQALKQGRLTQAFLVYRGQPDRFPYPNHSGVFDVAGQVEGVTMAFSPHWPALSKLRAQLRFSGERMDIRAGQGTIEGVNLDGLEAHIPMLSAEPAVLSIRTLGEGKVEKLQSLLAKAPLRELATQLKPLHWKGDVALRLALQIPLHDDTHTTLNGQVRLNKNRMRLEEPKIRLSSIDGLLTFNESGLTDGQLQGMWLNQPWQATLKQRTSQGKTTIDGKIKASIGSPQISSLLALARPSKHIQGNTLLAGKLSFQASMSGKAPHVNARFTSDLRGLELRLPLPLGKPADASTPITLTLETGVRTALNLQWPSKLQAQFSKQGKRALSGVMAIGDIHLPTVREGTINILANLRQMSVSEWLTLLPDEPPSATKSFPDVFARIHAETIHEGNLQLGDTVIEVETRGSGTPWFITAEGEQLKGTIFVPWQVSEEDPIEVKIDRWLMAWRNATETRDLHKSPPNFWPPTVFTCTDCRLPELKLGHIKASLAAKQGVFMWDAQWHPLEKTTASISGRWDATSTRVVLDGKGEGFHRLTQWLGFNSGLRESTFKTHLALLWPGAPWQFHLQDTKGRATLELGKGYLKEVSDKGARLFTLFSLQSLRRRLALDFSDVFNSGFYFDGIQGRFTLSKGHLFTDRLHVEGTAAGVDISGFTDLTVKTTEQDIVVTPKLSSSLPVLAGWAVSPATAVVAYILDKFFIKPALDVVTRIDYRMTGSLDAPQLIEVGKQKALVQVKDEQEN